MFELLEKQHLMSIFGALSGLLLFQDGVFANSFCDRLFAHIETDYDKITRSLHRHRNSIDYHQNAFSAQSIYKPFWPMFLNFRKVFLRTVLVRPPIKIRFNIKTICGSHTTDLNLSRQVTFQVTDLTKSYFIWIFPILAMLSSMMKRPNSIPN